MANLGGAPPRASRLCSLAQSSARARRVFEAGAGPPSGGSFRRSEAEKRRLQNVSTTGGESGESGWTAVNETERRNRLCFKRLGPEVARHHQLRKQACSEFESLPPSQPNSLHLKDLPLSRLVDFPRLPNWCPRPTEFASRGGRLLRSSRRLLHEKYSLRGPCRRTPATPGQPRRGPEATQRVSRPTATRSVMRDPNVVAVAVRDRWHAAHPTRRWGDARTRRGAGTSSRVRPVASVSAVSGVVAKNPRPTEIVHSPARTRPASLG